MPLNSLPTSSIWDVAGSHAKPEFILADGLSGVMS
jgi:hypothetical protein